MTKQERDVILRLAAKAQENFRETDKALQQVSAGRIEVATKTGPELLSRAQEMAALAEEIKRLGKEITAGAISDTEILFDAFEASDAGIDQLSNVGTLLKSIRFVMRMSRPLAEQVTAAYYQDDDLMTLLVSLAPTSGHLGQLIKAAQQEIKNRR